MRPPPYPQPGALRIEWGRAVVDAIRALWPVETPTVKPIMTGGGTGYHAKPGAAKAGVATIFRPPFAIYATNDGAAEDPQPRVGIVASTLGGALPSGMTTSGMLLAPQPGTNFVWLKVVITGGSITQREIGHGELPEDTASTYHHILGLYTFEPPEGSDSPTITHVQNYGYGPVGVLVCRDWYAAGVSYSVSFYFAGAFPSPSV